MKEWPVRGQIGLEFLVLTSFAMVALFLILVVLSDASSTNITSQRIESLINLGDSIRDEIFLASEMETGYYRLIDLPVKVRGVTYELKINESIAGESYLLLSSGNFEVLYAIPETTGNMSPGLNIMKKEETIIVMNP